MFLSWKTFLRYMELSVVGGTCWEVAGTSRNPLGEEFKEVVDPETPWVHGEAFIRVPQVELPHHAWQRFAA
jgi:hypothetical protein